MDESITYATNSFKQLIFESRQYQQWSDATETEYYWKSGQCQQLSDATEADYYWKKHSYWEAKACVRQ